MHYPRFCVQTRWIQYTSTRKYKPTSSKQVITTTAPLTMVRFAPDGSALLLAEQVPTGDEQVYLVQPRIGRSRELLKGARGGETALVAEGYLQLQKSFDARFAQSADDRGREVREMRLHVR
jgi:hypothetical protein